MYARQFIRVYPVQFFAEDERSGFNWGLSFINNHAFKSVSPEIAPAVMTSVIIPCKANLNFPHKFGKA